MTRVIKIGSCFSGIGGFELGIERAIPNSKTIWQIEQDKFCQKVLQKNYPSATIYKDIKDLKNENLYSIEPVHIIIGGFPCQDISNAGLKKGIAHGEKSSLWKDMFRIITHQRPFLVILENVKALLSRGRGMDIVIKDLEKVYGCVEWRVISAREMGAPHLRERVFIIGYERKTYEATNTNMQRIKKHSMYAKSVEEEFSNTKCRSSKNARLHIRNHWRETTFKSPICHLDDGISNRVAKLRALGNAIVPQCSEYVGRLIYNSGILDPLYEQVENKNDEHRTD